MEDLLLGIIKALGLQVIILAKSNKFIDFYNNFKIDHKLTFYPDFHVSLMVYKSMTEVPSLLCQRCSTSSTKNTA